jgi:hypothetical protein
MSTFYSPFFELLYVDVEVQPEVLEKTNVGDSFLSEWQIPMSYQPRYIPTYLLVLEIFKELVLAYKLWLSKT